MFEKNNHWQIAYRSSRSAPFKLLKNPDWAWAADPFLVKYRDNIYLFAELFLYASERNGVIGFCKYENGTFGEWTVTMDKHWHLSYPNVWVENNKLYMCPESYQAEEVAIYELQKFPNQWKKCNILLQNGEYVDTTFLEYKNTKYMFTYKISNNNKDTLWMYKINQNKQLSEPVLISEDDGVARPGGNFIVKDNKIIRVSQNCRENYGAGLVFSEVISLWPNYNEKILHKIGPKDVMGNWKEKIIGIHTYNSLDDLEVIDVKIKKRYLKENIARKRIKKVFLNKY